MGRPNSHLYLVLLSAGAFVLSCGSDGSDDAGPDITDEPIERGPCETPPSYGVDTSSCDAADTDYQPRDEASANDSWDACVTDDDEYHRIEPSVSSIARVAAYDAIGQLLWEGNPEPTHEDFVAARILFEEDQGLGSRVARRYDVHYEAPAEGNCDEEGIADANRDYCVGPAVLQPLIVNAFAQGSLGRDRIVNAAKIEAAIQWFLYVSSIKEATTCTEKPRDCDSSWAYYSGGTPRDNPVGLAADIDAYSPETHDRAYDGVLAVRCWRDLDDTDPASDLALRDRAIAQLDEALRHGMSILVRQRFLALECSSGDYRLAALEGLRILVPFLDRAMRERDSAAADFLLGELDKDAEAIDIAAAVAALDAAFPCP